MSSPVESPKLCSHENLVACVEQNKALSHKSKWIAFLFKATKMSEQLSKTKKTSKCEKEKCLIDYLLFFLAQTTRPYLYNSTLISLQLFKQTPISLQHDL
jgi:hypothetical protein